MSVGREGKIIGGVLLLMLDAYGISDGKLPLKGAHSISVAEFPELFWTYSIGLGLIGLAAIVWGLTWSRDADV